MGLGQGLGCSGVCAKYILFIVNIVVFLCGAALLGVGLALLLTTDAWDWFDSIIATEDPEQDALLLFAVYTMIAVGALLFVVGFFGCCGACKESKCMLTTYVVLVIIILLLQLAGAVLAIVFKSEFGQTIEDSMTKSVQERYGTTGNDATTRSWDEMQIDLKCCGSADHNDYFNSTYYNNTGNEVPESCCEGAEINSDGVVSINATVYTLCQEAARGDTGEIYHNKGCFKTMEEWVDENTTIVIAVLVGLGVIQILAVCFAFCIRDQLRT